MCSVRFEKFNRRPSLSMYLSPFYIGPALIVLDREETDLQAYAFLMTAFVILMIYLLTYLSRIVDETTAGSAVDVYVVVVCTH